MTVPPCGMIAAGLGANAGWPLNHMSAPAASLAPETGASGFGTANAGAFWPLGTKIVSPKPSVVSLILSPRGDRHAVGVEARVERRALDALQLALRRRAAEDRLGGRVGGGGEQQRAEHAGRRQVANPHGERIYGRPVHRARGLSGGKRCGYPACLAAPLTEKGAPKGALRVTSPRRAARSSSLACRRVTVSRAAGGLSRRRRCGRRGGVLELLLGAEQRVQNLLAQALGEGERQPGADEADAAAACRSRHRSSASWAPRAGPPRRRGSDSAACLRSFCSFLSSNRAFEGDLPLLRRPKASRLDS